MVVAGMAAHSEIGKAHEIANEVRRVTKQLKEAQGLSSTYNNRERLFGMPVTNVSGEIFNSTGQRPASYCRGFVSIVLPFICVCIHKLCLQKFSPQKL